MDGTGRQVWSNTIFDLNRIKERNNIPIFGGFASVQIYNYETNIFVYSANINDLLVSANFFFNKIIIFFLFVLYLVRRLNKYNIIDDFMIFIIKIVLELIK